MTTNNIQGVQKLRDDLHLKTERTKEAKEEKKQKKNQSSGRQTRREISETKIMREESI